MRFSMVSILLHVAFIGLWTFILNWICKKGFKWVSWGLVVLPYLFAALVWLIGVEIMAINGMEGFREGITTTKTTKPVTTKPVTTKPGTLKTKLQNLDNLTYDQISKLTSSDIDFMTVKNIAYNNDTISDDNSVKALMIPKYTLKEIFEPGNDGGSYADSRFRTGFYNYTTKKLDRINFKNISPNAVKFIDYEYFIDIPQDQINTLTSAQINILTPDQKQYIMYAGNTLPTPKPTSTSIPR